ncbi:hypothetical protein M075_0749 [Bacteroides fragilis str. 20793-3]|nr:hypothetical protein M075_0749 [Bacteroides fragilis str. 20793-3]
MFNNPFLAVFLFRLSSFGRRPRQRKRLFAVFLKPCFFFVLSLCIF